VNDNNGSGGGVA